MDTRHLRFYAALALFLAWVVCLGVLAVRTGVRPAARPAAVEVNTAP